ncbi:sodium-type flagellar protein MotY precursor [Photobacterium frigidiphilum]|uniref:Sodium-type flagellar protein MotY n=1 Tax=Photobacterium frigidiphilum TaxID=264736 RepID=A0A2T3JE68_9GAMM|nr:OmpA family protein [Photobacterium frigidiphilum]PSU47197.1 sodium-type flagellar protein MotY precursor [Photobacterium frigidiphilum]
MVIKSIITLLVLVVSCTVCAGDNVWISPLDSSTWVFFGSKTECVISHDVEGFGVVKIIAEAGVGTRLEIISKELKNLTDDHSVDSMPAYWAVEKVNNINYQGNVSFSLLTSELVFNNADEVFERLDQGEWIKIGLNGHGQKNDTVVISNVNFELPAKRFLSCKDDLILLNYQQVRSSEFYYPSGSTLVSKLDIRTAYGIAEYVKVIRSIKKVLIDGYSDSQGRSTVNLRISRERAEEMAALLIEFGVPQKMIQIRSHGDRYPIADNALADGRKKNRRVTVRLIKNSAAGVQ